MQIAQGVDPILVVYAGTSTREYLSQSYLNGRSHQLIAAYDIKLIMEKDVHDICSLDSDLDLGMGRIERRIDLLLCQVRVELAVRRRVETRG